MSNTFTCTGRLGKVPELVDLGGKMVMRFSIANNTGFGDHKQTLWLGCTYWKKHERLIAYLNQGTMVSVSGELTQSDKDGKQYLNLNVDRLDLIGGDNKQTQSAEGDAPKRPTPAMATAQESDSDMPF